LDRRCDRDVVTAICQGDRSAYAVLVRRHYSKVFLVCLGVLGRVHDAEDVAQEAMIAGLEKIRQLRDGEQFGPWIARIARNLSINLVRKNAAAERTLDRKPKPLVEQAGSDDAVRQAVARLPMELRLPLVMYYFDGRDVKSVARTLDISTSSVYAKLKTAIGQLHEILTAEDGEQQ
jgi:RNA polymerase sigma-70 factor (ECF subfamily)